ncbi:MAG: hypothetical protein IPJ65_10115 [Archangiaceae bacterium]|nr:hypothetical protein [Archangiaceae bacterium]
MLPTLMVVTLFQAGPPAAFLHEHQLATQHRALARALPRQPGAFGPLLTPALDFQAYDVDLQWDFRTGAVQGSATLRLSGLDATSGHVAFIVDSGVTAFAALTPSGPKLVQRQGLGGGLDFLDVATGATTDDLTLTLTWSGTLQCGSAFGAPMCARGAQPFVWLDHGSGVPLPYDPVSGFTTDTLRRSWVLHTPRGFAVRAAGDLVDAHDTATEHVTRWATGGPVALALNSWLVSGTALEERVTALPEAVVVSTASAQAPDVAAFVGRILPLEAQRFGPRASATVSQVIVPQSSPFIGTASHAMTLLNESYAALGPTLHEEVWAHENIHQHFAVRAYPADTAVESLLTEGLTTLLELDYTHRAKTGLARDLALAARQRELALVHAYQYPQALDLPLLLTDDAQVPADPYLYNAWAYFKGAATLEVLRLAVGEAVFDDALNRYLRACDAAPCTVATFRGALEAASARPLGPLFQRLVSEAHRLQVTVGFEGATVTLDQGSAGPLPLELWLTLDDGTLQRERWELTAARESRTFSTLRPVRSVRLNPRLEGLVRADPATAGDVDFDGEVDGFDLISCARLVGHRVREGRGERAGIWGYDLDFDRRCDLDHDGTLSAADVAALPFNTLRSSP